MSAPPYLLVRTAILRLLGLVYFVTFVSTIQQGPALVGEHGLLPARVWLSDVVRVTGSRVSAFVNCPRSSGSTRRTARSS